jgi:hypothetical protein
LRAWRLGEKLSFGVLSLLPGDLGSHRKGAKDAKGNSQGGKWRLVIYTRYRESSFLPNGKLLVSFLRLGLFSPNLSVCIGGFRINRDRRSSAPSAKKSLANQKSARFDRSKTSQLRCIAMFKAVFRIVRRAKSSKRKHWEKLRNRKIACTSILTPNASRPSDS